MEATRTIRFRLNGRPVTATIQPHETLVEVLRRCGHVYSVRESCGQGLCGTCTTIVNGVAVSSCLFLAAFADGADVVTAEGLGTEESMHPVQAAFVECGAFQCGFCTPGMVLMAIQLLAEKPQPTEDDIRRYLSGNLCRCAAYPEIIRAVRAAAERGNEASA